MRNDRVVELVGFLVPDFEGVVEIGERVGRLPVTWRKGGRGTVRQTKPNHLASARLHGHSIVSGGFRPLLLGVYRVLLTLNNVVVDAVLHVRTAVGHTKNALG